MRRATRLLFALLLTAPPLSAAPPVSPMPIRLRVMTYNIHSCKGMDGRVEPDRIGNVIAAFHPDIVALQEVRVGRVEPKQVDRPKTEGTGVTPPPVGEAPLPPPTVIPPRRPGETAGGDVPFTDQPRLIARVAEMGYVFYPLVRKTRQDYGIALLSRYPLRLVRAENLPTRESRWFSEKRGAIWAEVTIDGRTVQVIATHLGLSGAEREEQITELFSTRWTGSDRFQAPFVICGDLNSTTMQTPYRRLAARFVDAAEAAGLKKATFPSAAPGVRIDHIFLPRGSRAFAAEVPRNDLTKVSSDHLPLIVDVELAAEEPLPSATASPSRLNAGGR
jgi:endonuclease/exonuclease/phosphatase family metal-dependent hydrolase